MKIVRRVLARNRIKGARRELARDPSPRAYAAVAHEYAVLGLFREVCRVCDEGLGVFPGSTELSRLKVRAQRLEREERLVELKRELSEAPRPGVFEEICEVYLASGRPARAEEVARRWMHQTPGPEARCMLARVLTERYFADRGRDQGRSALAALDEVHKALPNDPRPLSLRLDVLTRIGAWDDARTTAAQLLQIKPGDPDLEARFRSLSAREGSASVDRALLEVENSGRFVDEENANRGAGGDVRPLLGELATEPDVAMAMYLRGSTVLLQGAKGATAERMARSVRRTLATGRTTARRLGLGQLFQVQLEGDFGSLLIAPGETDAGALWCRGLPSPARERALGQLAGLNAEVTEEEARESGTSA